jgi:hypothetical protein
MAWADGASATVHVAAFVENGWQCIKIDPGVKTNQGPVLGASGGRLFLFWLDQVRAKEEPNGNEGRRPKPSSIMYTSLRKDGSWDGPRVVPETCSDAPPCVVYFRGSLHLFWSHTPDHGRVHWTFCDAESKSEAEVTKWRLPSPLPSAATDETPSAAVLGDHLHLVWKEKAAKSIHWSVDPVDNRLTGLKWRDIGQQVAPLAQMVSAVGIVLYALARISIQAFYSELDISPETAGQSYLSTLIPVAVALGAFVILSALVVSVATLIAEWSWGGRQIRQLGDLLYQWPPKRNRAIHATSAHSVGIYFFSAFTLMALALLLFLLEWVGLFQVEAYVNIALLAIIVTPFVSLVIQSYVSGGKPYGVTMLAACLIAIVSIGVLAHQYGSAEGRAARHGNPLHNTFAGFSFPPLSATPIEVQLLNPQTGQPQLPPFEAGDCLLDLGEANGYVVLYDVPRATVWRLPQSAAVLSQSKTARGCIESTKQ